MRDARGDLDDGRAGEEVEDEGPRRGPALGVEDPSPGATAGRDRRRPHRSRARRGSSRRRPGRRRAARGRRGWPAARATRSGSRSTPAGGQAGAGEGEQVAADAAPQVDDAGRPGGGEARGTVLGHAEAGRLLQRVGREEHQRGEVAELRDRPRAELHLGRWPPRPGRGPARSGGPPSRRGPGHRHDRPMPGSPPPAAAGRHRSAARPASRGPRRHPVRRVGSARRPGRGRFSSVRKLLIVLVPVLLIAALAGGGIWLSQREEPATAAGTLVEQPRRRPAGGPQHGRAGPVGTAPGHDHRAGGQRRGRGRHARAARSSASRSSCATPRTRSRSTGSPTPRSRTRCSASSADGEAWELPALSGWADGAEVEPGARRQYVAVPGDAEEVSVTMTYDGVTQTIDAATADVSIGDAAPLYDAPVPGPGGPCGDQLWSTGAAATRRRRSPRASCSAPPPAPTSPASAGRRRARGGSW